MLAWVRRTECFGHNPKMETLSCIVRRLWTSASGTVPIFSERVVFLLRKTLSSLLLRYSVSCPIVLKSMLSDELRTNSNVDFGEDEKYDLPNSRDANRCKLEADV